MSILFCSTAAADDQTWLEYRPAVGCPSREVLGQELLRRLSHRVPDPKAPLHVHVEYIDGAYSGSVRLGDTEAAAARQVRNDNCNQVIHALSLIATLMLEGDAQVPAGPTVPSAPATSAPSGPKPVVEQVTVLAPPPTNFPIGTARARPIRSLTFGPSLALSVDGLADTSIAQFGGRVGATLTLHGLIAGTQQTLRLSLARVQSGTMTMPGDRKATIVWTSARFNACHGWGARRLATFAANDEVTAALMMLEQISLVPRGGCALDSPVETLELDFGKGIESYENDNYSGSPGDVTRAVVYVANLEWLSAFLENTWNQTSIPADYDRLTIEAPPRSEAEYVLANQCDTGYLTRYELDFATKQLTESDCSREVIIGAPPKYTATLSTQTKTLNDDSLNYVRAMATQLELGATRECNIEGAAIARATLSKNDVVLSNLVDGRAACPGQPYEYRSFIVQLDDLYWTLHNYLHPIL